MNIEMLAGDGEENIKVTSGSVEERTEGNGPEDEADEGKGVADTADVLASTARYYATGALPEPVFEVESAAEEKSDLQEYDIPSEGAPAAPAVSVTSGIASSRR